MVVYKQILTDLEEVLEFAGGGDQIRKTAVNLSLRMI